MYQRVVFVLVSGRVATLVGVVLSAHGSTCTGNRRWIPGHCLVFSNAGRGSRENRQLAVGGWFKIQTSTVVVCGAGIHEKRVR